MNIFKNYKIPISYTNKFNYEAAINYNVKYNLLFDRYSNKLDNH